MAAAKDTVTIRRTPDEEGDLVGAKGAAKIFNVERTRIARWQKMDKEAEERGDPERQLPPTVSRQPNGPIWVRAELEAKARERQE